MNSAITNFMNLAVTILMLLLFAGMLVFAFLYTRQRFLNKFYRSSRKIIKLTKEVELIKNRLDVVELSDNRKVTTAPKAANPFEAMENRAASQRKHVVKVGDDEIAVPVSIV